MPLFPRENRLTRPCEFQRVFERGLHRRVQLEGFFARVREGTQTHARLGFALSKRSLKRAVDRNRIKRLARESFRLHHHQLSGIDIVIMSQADVAQADNAAILHQLDVLWQRLGKLYPPRRAVQAK